jgi:NAD(P)-dependent dehydrogenase (short-subunit alcohol dehydrogenase family)
MQTLEHQRVLVVGGSRGLGLGLTEALIARRANVHDPRAAQDDAGARGSSPRGRRLNPAGEFRPKDYA